MKKPETAEGAVSDDEMDAVVGGKACYCFLGGGGESSNESEKVCACVACGAGFEYDMRGELEIRCCCPLAGEGM